MEKETIDNQHTNKQVFEKFAHDAQCKSQVNSTFPFAKPKHYRQKGLHSVPGVISSSVISRQSLTQKNPDLCSCSAQVDDDDNSFIAKLKETVAPRISASSKENHEFNIVKPSKRRTTKFNHELESIIKRYKYSVDVKAPGRATSVSSDSENTRSENDLSDDNGNPRRIFQPVLNNSNAISLSNIKSVASLEDK